VRSFALTFAFTFAFAGCNHASNKPTPCAPGLPAQLEVRDGAGLLELAVKPSNTTGELDLCDGQSKRIGRLIHEGEIVTVLDAANQTVARLHPDGPLDWAADGPKGPLFRFHTDKTASQLIQPDGIMFGMVTPTDGGATLYNRASVPVGSVAPREKGQVVAAADGATRRYITPASSSVNAGLLAIPGLPLSAEVAIFLSASKSSR
jgi:hypothetical protein